MRRHRLAATLGAALIAMMASAAMAQPDVELAFDPVEACPGDQVTFFSSIENLGTEPSLIDLEITVSIDQQPLFTFPGQTYLGAGEMRSVEIPFWVPPPVPPLALMIEVVAEDAFGSDTASAELTILDCGGPGDMTGTELSDVVGEELKSSPLFNPTNPDPDAGTTWGQLKAIYAQ